MPKPIALCIEDTNPDPEKPRYVACVAVAGGLPGLGLDRQGSILWQSPEKHACELWVSGDERLILLRPAGAIAVRVLRGGRSLAAPVGKPVVLLDQDELELGGRRFKLHVHGLAKAIAPPAPITETEPKPSRGLRSAAAALALGSLLAGGCIEVRAHPPKLARPTSQQEIGDKPPTPDGGAPAPRDAAAKPDAQPSAGKAKTEKTQAKPRKPPAAKKSGAGSPPPIEVRDKPPSMRWD